MVILYTSNKHKNTHIKPLGASYYIPFEPVTYYKCQHTFYCTHSQVSIFGRDRFSTLRSCRCCCFSYYFFFYIIVPSPFVLASIRCQRRGVWKINAVVDCCCISKMKKKKTEQNKKKGYSLLTSGRQGSRWLSCYVIRVE